MRFDKVLYNGNFITMDAELSRKKWAAVKDGKIAALGDDDNYPQDAAELIDLKGATALPGLVDCHNHIPIAGLRLKSVDLADAGTIAEVLRRMEEACLKAEEGEYVYGSNYIPQAIAEVRYPTAEELDAICHGHLVFIIAATLHACATNTPGIAIADVPDDLPGVEVVDGKQIGNYLSDESSFVATANIVGSLDDEHLWDLIKGCAEFSASMGLTAIHGLFGQFVKNDRDVDLILERGHELPIDVTVWYQTWDPMEAKARGLERVGGCLTLDGAGFEYTMANFEPYDTAPALRGVLYHTDDEVYQVIKTAHENDMQVTLHAVGERAIDQLIWTYHRVFTEQGKKDLRHRLEHLCMPTQDQIEKAKELGLILSMQPGFTYEWDEDFAVILGRERGDRIDPFKRVLEAGNIICAGSDCPVTKMTPLTDLAFLVRGKTFKGNTNLVRVVPLTEAIKMFTTNAAYAIKAEDNKGSIEIGKDADFSVIDRDPYEYENSDELYEMKPVLTMNKGNVIYSVL